MLPARYRLTRSEDFRRVQRENVSWSNRLLVLCKAPNDLPHSRVGFSASRRIGISVTRNRTRRLMREAVRSQLDLIVGGWDIVFIARQGVVGADYWAVLASVSRLLNLSGLIAGGERPGVAEGEQKRG